MHIWQEEIDECLIWSMFYDSFYILIVMMLFSTNPEELVISQFVNIF